MDCRPPGSSLHGIFQARILEWVAISFSRGSSQGLSPHLLHWQVDSLPLSQLGSPQFSSVESLSSVRLFGSHGLYSTPGLPVHHQPPEPTQSHVHGDCDAIQYCLARKGHMSLPFTAHWLGMITWNYSIQEVSGCVILLRAQNMESQQYMINFVSC